VFPPHGEDTDLSDIEKLYCCKECLVADLS